MLKTVNKKGQKQSTVVKNSKKKINGQKMSKAANTAKNGKKMVKKGF